MAWKAGLILLCFILGAFAQTTRVQKSIIDDYVVETPVIVIAITSTTVLPFQQFATTLDSNVLGGERDLILRANSGSAGRVFTSGVSEGQWNVATPNGASGVSSTQYDGTDASDNLNPKGLGGIDLTSSSVDSFKLTIQTDISTTYVIDVTDMSGGSSTQSINIPGAPGVINDYFVTFVTFTGNADFTKAGSVTLTIQGFDNVDTLVNIFSLAAPDTTPPPPPGVSPSPSPIPGDTWYRFDDDDDGKSPCGEEADEQTVFLADYNIIYYYFYGFQRPYIYVSNPNNNDAALLIPSIFACVIAFFAL
jgi:hypothetical protein